MEEKGIGSQRQSDLKKSFKLGVQGLLTTCSKQEFCKVFPRFTKAEQECLHSLYIQVIMSLHQNTVDEFEDLCQEVKVGNVLDTIEEFVEEETLDPLYHDKTKVKDLAKDLASLKRNEIQNLTTMLEKKEAQNKVLRSRVELLQKELQGPSGTSNALEKANT